MNASETPIEQTTSEEVAIVRSSASPVGMDEMAMARALLLITTGSMLLAAGALSFVLVDIGQTATGLGVALLAAGLFLAGFGFRLAFGVLRCAATYGREVAKAQRDVGRERVVVED